MLDALKKLWAFLPLKQRIRFVWIVGLMTMAATMEMIGIGALLPIIGVMQAPELIQTNGTLSALSAWLGDPSSQAFFIVLLVGLLVFFVLKNLFLIYLDFFQHRYLSALQGNLSSELLKSYLRRPYAFHLQTNTAQLIRNVTSEVTSVFYYTFVPIVSLLSESLVILALFLLILVVDPKIAVLLTFFGGLLVFGFYRVFRQRMYQIGKQLQDSSGRMIQQAQEGLGGVKEIKVMGREKFFEAAFSRHVASNARALRRALVIHNFPMRFLETLFVAIFVGMLIVMTYLSKSGELIPLIGVYAAATFRLIPSLNRIMTAINRLKQGSSSLKLVVAELSNADAHPRAEAAEGLKFADRITVAGLHYRYPEAETEALRDVSLEIRQGEMVGFVGRSGSGKTSLVDCILGLLTPTRGKVLVDGVDIQQRLGGWRSQIGYIPQHIYLTDDSLRKNVALGLDEEAIDQARIWRALEAAQLADFAKELPAGLETSIGEGGVRLSGGQRQRIGIARAMYYDPPVLILDEATSALDNETEKAIVNTISGLKGSKTILVIAHRMTTIEDCDRVFVLDRGVLVDEGAFDQETQPQQA